MKRAPAAVAVGCVFVTVAAVALGVATQATAGSQATAVSHPWFGIYDCMVPMDLGVVGGGVQIPAYFKLMGNGRYISALQLMGRTLKGTTAGRWRQRGHTVTWVSGTYARAGFYGVWNARSSMHPQGFIAMFSKKTHAPVEIACYPNLTL